MLGKGFRGVARNIARLRGGEIDTGRVWKRLIDRVKNSDMTCNSLSASTKHFGALDDPKVFYPRAQKISDRVFGDPFLGKPL